MGSHTVGNLIICSDSSIKRISRNKMAAMTKIAFLVLAMCVMAMCAPAAEEAGADQAEAKGDTKGFVAPFAHGFAYAAPYAGYAYAPFGAYHGFHGFHGYGR